MYHCCKCKCQSQKLLKPLIRQLIKNRALSEKIKSSFYNFRMSLQEQPNYNSCLAEVFLLEGWHQIYFTNALKAPVKLQNMIPLQAESLPQQSTKYLQYLSALSKQKYVSQDIWRGLLALNQRDLIKCFIYYSISSSSFLLYSIVSIYLFQVLFENKKAIDLGHAYWLVLLLCSVWFFQNIFIGMGYNLLGKITHNSKRILFYSLYVRLISHQFYGLKGQIKGKVLNALTEFHDILQDCSWLIIEVLSSCISIVGIFVIFLIKLGWLGFVFLGWSVLMITIHLFYSDYNSQHSQVIAKLKDKRMSYLSETVSFLKYIKMQRWEGLFMRRISSIRREEFKSNIKYASGNGFAQVIESCIFQPAILLTLVVAHNFTSIQINSKLIAVITLLLCMLNKSFVNMSLAIKSYFEISVIFGRVAQFFSLSYSNKSITSNQKHINNHVKQSKYVVSLKQVQFGFEKNKAILDGVSLDVSPGEFVTIIGPIGSGKTTLLDCISFQTNKVKGSISVTKQLVYLEQEPPIFSGLLRSNITLNNLYLEQDYNHVVELCCLNEDFERLQNRDLTYIQEKLTNLSGGQTARIALARALYSKNKVLLLDDPLSSLDIKVGQKIYNNLMKICKEEGYTVIMTLHQINFITQHNKIYLLQDGKLKNLNFQQIISLHFCQNQNVSLKQDKSEKSGVKFSLLEQQVDDMSQVRSVDLEKYDLESQKSQYHQLQQQKQTEFLKGLLSYVFCSKVNYFFFPITAIIFIISEFLYILTIQLFSKYDELRINSTYFQTFTNFIVIIGLLTCVTYLCYWARILLLGVCVQNSNQQIFKEMTYALMKGSVSYYRGRSSGDVLDKYSVDFGALDSILVFHLQQYICASFYSISCFMYLIIYKPILGIFLVLLLVCGYLFHAYCAAAVVLQRQQSLLHKGAPIITHFEQTIKGLKTIQTYNLEQMMKQKMVTLLQNSMKSCLSYHKTLNTYFIYSKHLSNLIVSVLFFMVVKLSENDLKQIFYPTIALFDISWSFYYIYAETLNVSSVLYSHKRIQNFVSQINKYKESINLGCNERNKRQQQPRNQYSECVIQIRNLTLRYSLDANPALKNINISIKKGAKVAIVGRTGSGKSSFVHALYRLVQPDFQSFYQINGENALQKSLEELRSNLSCIPQHPFIFNDSLRKNLDPFNLSSDQLIQSVLAKLNLLDIVAISQKGLYSSISHKEINFSLGETQLICLARVILQRKDIIVMDEAGSNVDEKTDGIIKSVIKQQFKNKTLISIAHKLLTILDYDTILVFDKGEIVERGTAVELINQKQIFYGMIEENPQIAERAYKMLGHNPHKEASTN